MVDLNDNHVNIIRGQEANGHYYAILHKNQYEMNQRHCTQNTHVIANQIKPISAFYSQNSGVQNQSV